MGPKLDANHLLGISRVTQLRGYCSNLVASRLPEPVPQGRIGQAEVQNSSWRSTPTRAQTLQRPPCYIRIPSLRGRDHWPGRDVHSSVHAASETATCQVRAFGLDQFTITAEHHSEYATRTSSTWG